MSAPVNPVSSRNVVPPATNGRAAAPRGNIEFNDVPGAFGDNTPIDEVILATGGYDHTIRFWQAKSGQCIRTVQHVDSQINAMDISPDGQLLAACGYQHIRMFDALGANANPVVNYEGVSKNVMAVGFQDQGRWMYTGGEDGTVKIWDLRMRNLQCQKIYTANSPVNTVALHPNQQDLIVGDQNGTIHIWNIRSDKFEQHVPEPGASIQCVHVDAMGQMMAAVTNKGSCHVTNINFQDNGKVLVESREKIPAHKRYGLKCLFSPDSTVLATSSADQSTKIWRTKDLTLVTELKVENQRWVWDLAFSADSQLMFTATSDNIARLWSLPKNEVIREYIGHQKALTCLAFRDGRVQ